MVGGTIGGRSGGGALGLGVGEVSVLYIVVSGRCGGMSEPVGLVGECFGGG